MSARVPLLELFEAAPGWQPADGTEILNEIMAFLLRFVAMTANQARAVALWVVHTHAFKAADTTPYLDVDSAEKQSGKTRLLEVLRLLVAAPWFTGRVTAAVLVRKIDAVGPTLLLDESDAAFNGPEEYAEALRAVLNSGYRRGGMASLCVSQGDRIDFRDFSVFCAKAIAGIGRLPDTVADRSIPIRLKRARRGSVERFRERDAEREAKPLREEIAAWCAANLDKLRDARPEIPSELSDRQADCCEALLAIADLRGGDWPKQAREALVKLCGEAQVDDDSIGIRLLTDIHSIFEEQGVAGITSTTLTEELAKIETSPWGAWCKGKPMTPAKLARRLKPFGIFPGQIQGGTARGYKVGDFAEAFCLYLPSPAFEGVKVSESLMSTSDQTLFKVSARDTSKNDKSPMPKRLSDTLTLSKPGNEGAEDEDKL